MKYKSSEVTNSSSTSFVISAYASGFVMGIPHDDLFMWVEKFWPTAIPKSFLSIGTEEITVELLIENFDEDWPDNDGVVLVNLTKATRRVGSTLSKIEPVTQVIMQATGPVTIRAKQKITFNKLRNLYTQVCEHCLVGDGEGELYYSQQPVDFSGDGWDGGDPMGDYAYTDDCKVAESILTKIICVKRDGVIKMGEERKDGNT